MFHKGKLLTLFSFMFIYILIIAWTCIGGLTVALVNAFKFKLNTDLRKLVVFTLLGPVIWAISGILYFFKP